MRRSPGSPLREKFPFLDILRFTPESTPLGIVMVSLEDWCYVPTPLQDMQTWKVFPSPAQDGQVYWMMACPNYCV
jgi:hypothetical protein